MKGAKTVIFLGDGMADEPIADLTNRTPLQYAHTPGMDSIAREGRSGTLLTLPKGFPTSSEVANMSVLGCDLATEYPGRGPLEAVGRGIDLSPQDIAFRLNLVTAENGILTDFSAGHPAQELSQQLITELNVNLGSDSVHFHSGVSYRNLLVLSDPAMSTDIATEKPDDNYGEVITEHLPKATTQQAHETQAALHRIITQAPAVLENSPINKKLALEGKPQANAVWPWSGGRLGSLRQLNDKYGISGAAITAVDVILGLAKSLGMEVINVPGATGYIDTNYEGKADAAIAAIEKYDLVYVHVEAIDEVSHAKDLAKKLGAIEDFDSKVVSRVLNAVGPEVTTVVLPDHPVPVATGRHTRTPVPVSIRRRGQTPDIVNTFDEITCPQGSLGAMRNGDLMALLFGHGL